MLSLVRDKFARPLRRATGAENANVGILIADPEDTTPAASPIALICEFSHAVEIETLRQAHRLAWNFSRSPLLITVEPDVIRAWTCCEPPEEPSLAGISAEIEPARVEGVGSLTAQTAKALHWVNLISGEFFHRYAERFSREGRADQQLLLNLQALRRELKKLDLSSDVAHDLIARVIFIQFLFDRRDADGNPSLNRAVLARLWSEGVLAQQHRSLTGILRTHTDTYNLFRWLNDIFNGDLFPGKGRTDAEREQEWQDEMGEVKEPHLRILADFVEGRRSFTTEQLALWPMYSFESIPLDFISSIYESFIDEDRKREGTVYTPGFLVDFVLDSVLPWDSADWNVRVLDPSCGSGIFLVKAYQRLVHRWRTAHGRVPGAADLRWILENCIYGIDIDPHAVRVASFSLYLALCEELDPKLYLTEMQFPQLRDRTLQHADFFDPDVFVLPSEDIDNGFDLVTGNAPWGRRTMTTLAHKWAKHTGWNTAYFDIGPLFLAKAAALSRDSGAIAILQPAGGILFNRVRTALEFRQRFFSDFDVEEIVNLSTLRFGLFPDAIAPSCLVIFRPTAPTDRYIRYISPKPSGTAEDQYRIIIQPHDVHLITRQEAVADPWIWSALAWGSRRDLNLIHRLSKHQTLDSIWRRKQLVKRQGVIRGDLEKTQPEIVGRRMLTEAEFPMGTFLRLDATLLQVNSDPRTHSRDSTSYAAFELPQLLVKQGWRKEHGRFEAVMVDPSTTEEGVLCSKSYLSIHTSPDLSGLLEAACVVINSSLAMYYFMLTSGRFASYRPEVNVQDILELPLPQRAQPRIGGISDYASLDRTTIAAFNLNPTESVLMEDLLRYTLSDFKEGGRSLGWSPTRRSSAMSSAESSEPTLSQYCSFFIGVLKAGFGADKEISATIYREQGARLPLRLLAVHLNWPGRKGLHTVEIDNVDLLQRLTKASELLGIADGDGPGFIRHRFIRVYGEVSADGMDVPTIFLIKPDRQKYWTRAAAMRDADDVSAEIVLSRPATAPGVDRAK